MLKQGLQPWTFRSLVWHSLIWAISSVYFDMIVEYPLGKYDLSLEILSGIELNELSCKNTKHRIEPWSSRSPVWRYPNWAISAVCFNVKIVYFHNTIYEARLHISTCRVIIIFKSSKHRLKTVLLIHSLAFSQYFQIALMCLSPAKQASQIGLCSFQMSVEI